ncbi:MAG: hypothetical protein HYY40_04300 [Bacteroidetes bacterium]|nr:hypothetical protein [Bacteroidota bacterium]
MNISFIYLLFGLILIHCSCRNRNDEQSIENSINQHIQTQGESLLKDYYTDGKIKTEGILINGKKNGVWKEYASNGKIEKVNYYYKDTLIHKLDPLDFDLETKILDDKSSILLPKHWNIQENYQQALVIAIKPKVFKPEIFNPTINVVKMFIPDSFTIEKIVELNIEEIKQGVKEFKLKESVQVSKSTIPMIKALYFVDTGTQKLGAVSTYIQDKSTVYIITCLAQGNQLQFVKYKDLFEEIVLSFKVSTPNV